MRKKKRHISQAPLSPERVYARYGCTVLVVCSVEGPLRIKVCIVFLFFFPPLFTSSQKKIWNGDK